jgi:UDP-N-acetylmuramoylalanine--D-glutamate ligase
MQSGIEYINDSLSTTPEATKAALEIFKDQPIVLIFGGYDRGLDFAEFCEYLYSFPLVGLVVFPPSGTRFLTQFKDFSPSEELPFPTAITTDMPTAIAKAREWLSANETAANTQKPAVVLLSPGSPSFGLFKDYAQRGEAFGRAAKE